MSTPLDIAKRLQAGETVKMSFETKTQKNDFDYEVLKKLLDLYNNDMKEASRALVRLRSTPVD
jgi:hypothetical protein